MCGEASFGHGLLRQICLPAIACMFTVDDIALLESKEPKSRVSLGLQDEMPSGHRHANFSSGLRGFV